MTCHEEFDAMAVVSYLDENEYVDKQDSDGDHLSWVPDFLMT